LTDSVSVIFWLPFDNHLIVDFSLPCFQLSQYQLVAQPENFVYVSIFLNHKNSHDAIKQTPAAPARHLPAGLQQKRNKTRNLQHPGAGRRR
jgi:hypothetical protein